MTEGIYQKAFSLVELLLVLALLGVMFLVVVPYGCELSGKNRASAYAYELMTALRFARSSAILLGEPVSFCGSKGHKECDGWWQEGQIVKTDSGKVLRVLPKIFRGDKFGWKGSVGGQEGEVVFLPTGFVKGQQTGSFRYCPKNNLKNALRVVLLPTGRARVSYAEQESKRINCSF